MCLVSSCILFTFPVLAQQRMRCARLRDLLSHGVHDFCNCRKLCCRIPLVNLSICLKWLLLLLLSIGKPFKNLTPLMFINLLLISKLNLFIAHSCPFGFMPTLLSNFNSSFPFLLWSKRILVFLSCFPLRGKIIEIVHLFIMFFIISVTVSWFDKSFRLESYLAFPVSSQTEARKGGCLHFPRQTVCATFC